MLRSERGATAIIVAGSLVLLFGIAAIAVDYTAALNERRQNVGAADTAALGGILEAAITTNANALQAAVDEAKQIAETNNDAPISNADWAVCVDPDALARPSTLGLLSITGGSQCISFNENFTRMRVRLPDQETEAAFGGAIGTDTIRTWASAEATIGSSTGEGSFPTGVFSTAAPGGEFCIKNPTPASGNQPPSEACAGPSTGDFGPFIPWFYSSCTAGNNVAGLSRAMALGLDHLLGTTPIDNPANPRVNGSTCPQMAGPAFPFTVDSSSGNMPSALTDGMLSGSLPGRLRRSTDPQMTVFGNAINNVPLWAYFDPAVGLTGDCLRLFNLGADPSSGDFISAGFTSTVPWQEAENALKNCLATTTGRLFDDDILDSPRFVVVPRFHEAVRAGNNAARYDIAAFEPAFIQGIWTIRNTQYSCTTEIFQGTNFCRHQPGMDGEITRSGGGGNGVLSSASALLLRCGHLPDDICSTVSSGGPTRAFFLNVELVE